MGGVRTKFALRPKNSGLIITTGTTIAMFLYQQRDLNFKKQKQLT